jgi:hypothetical protein
MKLWVLDDSHFRGLARAAEGTPYREMITVRHMDVIGPMAAAQSASCGQREIRAGEGSWLSEGIRPKARSQTTIRTSSWAAFLSAIWNLTETSKTAWPYGTFRQARGRICHNRCLCEGTHAAKIHSPTR